MVSVLRAPFCRVASPVSKDSAKIPNQTWKESIGGHGGSCDSRRAEAADARLAELAGARRARARGAPARARERELGRVPEPERRGARVRGGVRALRRRDTRSHVRERDLL